MKQLWMGLQMADKDTITNIKDLKEYLKYLLNDEIRHREKNVAQVFLLPKTYNDMIFNVLKYFCFKDYLKS